MILKIIRNEDNPKNFVLLLGAIIIVYAENIYTVKISKNVTNLMHCV